MSENKSYNGWTNYETWAVALWIDNDQSTQEQAADMARDTRRRREYLHELADQLKSWVTDEMLPDLGASLAADLLGAAVSEVDWAEIADHYLSDLDDEDSDTATA